MEDLKLELLKQKAELEQILQTLEQDIAKAPNGRVRIGHKAGKAYYYLCESDPSKDSGKFSSDKPLMDNMRTSRNGKYLKKDELDVLPFIFQRDYANAVKRKILPMIAEMDKLLKTYDLSTLQLMRERLPQERKNNTKPYFLSDEEFIQEWKSGIVIAEAFYEEEKCQYTSFGMRVRSKSEVIIAEQLEKLGIPYIYEAELRLGKGYGVHPDFMVLNVRKRKEYIWEHFGMMDDENYCSNAIRKIENYQKNGFFPGKELLLTFESKNRPLNAENVRRMIEEYLL